MLAEEVQLDLFVLSVRDFLYARCAMEGTDLLPLDPSPPKHITAFFSG
jgi:hypothetical protein